MNSTPKISIIIPTHNRRELLEETLNSIKSQSFKDWECIVIDDASSDNTWEYLQTINDEQFNCLHFDKGQERSRARNHGLKQARGAAILFLDDDDLLPENTLELHLKNLQAHPYAFCSIGSSQLFWPDGRTEDWLATRSHTCRDITHEILFGWIPVSGQCLFRKQNVIDIGGWNENMSYAEDHEFMLRLASTHPAVVMKDTVHCYRCHDQWRPDNMEDIMIKLREQHVDNMPDKKKKIAQDFLAARELREPAEQAYQNANMLQALKLYLKIFYLAPDLFTSPLTRADVLPALVKSSLGGPFIRASRAVKSLLK
jgi:glycosyltransferase involved in cell wall biosynthesis